MAAVAAGLTTPATCLCRGLAASKEDKKIDAPGGNIIPEGNDLKFQSNLNRWIVNSFRGAGRSAARVSWRCTA